MLWNINFFNWIFDNYLLIVQFLLVVLVPLILIIHFSLIAYHKIKNEKVINGIVISNYMYNVISNHAKSINEPVKKRISTILNTSYNITDRYWR